jgi:hypothetical protein
MLVDGVEGEGAGGAVVETAAVAPVKYHPIVANLSSEAARQAAERLRAAGIPFGLEGHGYGLRLGVKAEDFDAATAMLEQEDILPKRADPSEPAVALEGGPCPACGDRVAAGAAECPGCGLGLAGPAVTCLKCGGEIDGVSTLCRACGGDQP